MLCATVLTPMSANGIQCNHPSAAWISQFSVLFKTTNKQITNKKKQTKAKREHRPPKIKRRQSIPVRKCVIPAPQMRERYMTEMQGWIAIVLLLLILVQLVMVGSEMRGLRKNFTSRIDALYQKFFGTD